MAVPSAQHLHHRLRHRCLQRSEPQRDARRVAPLSPGPVEPSDLRRRHPHRQPRRRRPLPVESAGPPVRHQSWPRRARRGAPADPGQRHGGAAVVAPPAAAAGGDGRCGGARRLGPRDDQDGPVRAAAGAGVGAAAPRPPALGDDRSAPAHPGRRHRRGHDAGAHRRPSADRVLGGAAARAVRRRHRVGQPCVAAPRLRRRRGIRGSAPGRASAPAGDRGDGRRRAGRATADHRRRQPGVPPRHRPRADGHCWATH